LQARVAGILGVDPAAVPAAQTVTGLGMDSIMVSDLVRALSNDLGIPIHPREVFGAESLEALAGSLTGLLTPAGDTAGSGPFVIDAGNAFDLEAVRAALPETPNPPCAFVLSAPRSGSTLLRAMLSAHPQVFAPPELHLLTFAGMKARRERFGADHHLDEGLLGALMELRGVSLAEAKAALEALESEDAPTHAVWRTLQEECAPRMFVEKAPVNTIAYEFLERAEAMVRDARFIVLHRHPHAVIDSCVRTRMPWVFDLGAGEPHDVSEALWLRCNENCVRLLESVPRSRCLQLAYEDLVREPEQSAHAVCALLGLPFDDAVLQPYAQGRMIRGLVSGDAALGDPNFLKRRAIDPALADAWRAVTLPRPLTPEASALAERLGYELPGTSPAGSHTPTASTANDLKDETI
jgi:acyl carrier protein